MNRRAEGRLWSTTLLFSISSPRPYCCGTRKKQKPEIKGPIPAVYRLAHGAADSSFQRAVGSEAVPRRPPLPLGEGWGEGNCRDVRKLGARLCPKNPHPNAACGRNQSSRLAPRDEASSRGARWLQRCARHARVLQPKTLTLSQRERGPITTDFPGALREETNTSRQTGKPLKGGH